MPGLKRGAFAGAALLGVSALLLASAAQAQPSPSAAGDAVIGGAGRPILAIVALSEQHITVYNTDGGILRAPVSSGRPGYETPVGIYSVIQKEAEH